MDGDEADKIILQRPRAAIKMMSVEVREERKRQKREREREKNPPLSLCPISRSRRFKAKMRRQAAINKKRKKKKSTGESHRAEVRRAESLLCFPRLAAWRENSPFNYHCQICDKRAPLIP